MPGYREWVWAVPAGLALGALGAWLAGATGLALLLVGLTLIGLVGAGRFARRDAAEVDQRLTAEEVDLLRAERSRSGEVSAVRLLRSRHQHLSLRQAVRMVRDL